ncbi:MAG: hypothetical protein GX496_12260 [Firmicutes bacterium]|uniref:Uncharacterized protein n=1 Tax=Geochorda subterranea TaxID=3109564 RepID=A0ABZ1BQ58_9FIRM|nr:hypothetical protein [Limnochorda sp. LNt]NLG70312.1 hypothetical protein [Bacillota bacterium]WRP14691.1 hypothetical protein VLY81_00535 [Limnochorda sp. LNt]
MDLLDHLERVRLRLAAAYRRLRQEGAITEEQLEAVMEVIDRIEHLPLDEVRRRLQELGHAAADRRQAEHGGGSDPGAATPAAGPGGEGA